MKILRLLSELIQVKLDLDSALDKLNLDSDLDSGAALEEIEFRICQIRDIVETLEEDIESIYYLQPEVERKIILKFFQGLCSEKEMAIEYGVDETVIKRILFHFIISILKSDLDFEID